MKKLPIDREVLDDRQHYHGIPEQLSVDGHPNGWCMSDHALSDRRDLLDYLKHRRTCPGLRCYLP